MERCGDDTNRCLDAMHASRDPAHISERSYQADRSMATHRQISDIIKKDHSRSAARIDGLAQERAYDNIRSSRLIHDSATKGILFSLKTLHAFGQRAGA
jgi:hypothetical protein